MNRQDNTYKTIQDFVSEIRLIYKKNETTFNSRLTSLIEKHFQQTSFKNEITDFFYTLLETTSFIKAFTEYGISSNRGFPAEVTSRLKYKLLPPVFKDNELGSFIKYVFSNPNDVYWLTRINLQNWEYLFSGIDKTNLRLNEKNFAHQLARSIVLLSNGLTNIGVDPYLVNKLPQDKDCNECFLNLNSRINLFVSKHQNDSDLCIDTNEVKQLLVLLSDCEKTFAYLRNNKDISGISLHLTFILERAQQHITRLKLLLKIYISDDLENQSHLVAGLIKVLVIAEFDKYSVIKFFKSNANLLVYRIVSHTSEKGEHYIGFNKTENRKLFMSSIGGGVIVVFLVFIKNFIHNLPNLSLFSEGLLYGINYSCGFIVMHLLHFTLATKQPAMTASFIAENIENKDEKKKLSLVLAQIIRSQFISLIGNLIVVLPVCFLIAWSINKWFDMHVFKYSGVEAQLTSNHPLYSGALIFAAITGVYLSLSGLITGYYDNKVVFSDIPNRIKNHPRLKKKMDPKRLTRFASFIEKNTGAIIGNLFLGMVLGCTGPFSKFIGVPIDIRHITISAGNFGITLGSVEFHNMNLVIAAFIGIILIGLINIAVSFLLSFYIACRSRNVSHMQTLIILKELFKDVLKKPSIILLAEK